MKRILSVVFAALMLLVLMTGTALADNKFYFDKTYNTVFEGQTLQLVLIREGDCADEGDLTFKSSNQKAVTVDDDGMIYGVGKGSAAITATLKGTKRTWTAKLTVTCARAVTEVQVSQDKLPLYESHDPLVADVLDPASEYADLPVLVLRVGKSQTISATLLPKDANNRKWTLTTSDPEIVKASGTSFTGKRAGECLVTVQSNQNPEVFTAYRALVVQPVTKVKIVSDENSLYVGESLMLDATVSPDSATIRQVKWTSDNEKNVTVDEYGVVTAVSKGSATIRATAADGSGQYGTFKITVKQQPESLELSDTEFTLKAGNYKTLKATVLPAATNDKAVVWSSSDASVAKVNSSGRVTAVEPGTAIITCESKTHPHVFAQAIVNVYQPVTKISFTDKNPTVAVGDSIYLGWEVSPETATDPSVTLSTNKESIISVSQDGRITGLKRGEAYVYAKANDGSGKEGRIKVTVTQPVQGVSVKYDEVSVGVGSKVSNTAVFTPSDASITNMTWYAEDANIAKVSGTGSKVTVTGKAWGETTIIGVSKDGSFVTTFTVSVGNYDEALQIANLYVENNNTIRIAVHNQSNMNITRFYYEIETYDAWGNRVVCNDDYRSNSFEGSYNYTLAPGESTRHGRFSFGSDFLRPESIGRVVMTITGYETDDGFSRYIRQENREPFEWSVTILDGENY